MQNTQQEIEVPRLQSCSFYAYSLNESCQVVILMRNKKDSKNPDFFVDFGTKIRETEPNIYYSAARSFLKKTAGLCLESEIENLGKVSEVKKKVKETLLRNEGEIFTHPKVKEMYNQFIYNRSHMVTKVIGENHLVLFYPLIFFKLETINKVFSESDKYTDLSVHWITLNQVADQDFKSKYLSAFDFQIICTCAEDLSNNLNQKDEVEFKYPDYAVMILDEREHNKYQSELLFKGQYVDSDEIWEFYKPFEFEFPSNEELKHLKGIIFPGSKHSVYDKTVHWLEQLINFVRMVYEEYKHIKLVGICFGHQLIAYSLGGNVEKMPDIQNPLYIGREEIELYDSFYEIPSVKNVIQNLTKEDVDRLYVCAVHGDHVSKLPEGAILHGSSLRTHNEIYTIGERVLCFQAHPEFNPFVIQELIVNKLYEVGRIDDSLKNEFMEDIYDINKPLNRNMVNKIIYEFLKH